MKFSDLVKETTTATTTAIITLLGSPSGFKPFSSAQAFSVGATDIPVCVKMGAEWELSLYTLTSASVLTRQEVLASSNSNNAVTFSAGTKEVFNTVPASFLNGVATADLTTATTVQDGDYFPLLRPGVGDMKVLASVVKAYMGTAPVADTVAPSLSSASATATGSTTATATVTTNEGAGTLYCLITTASTATAAQVKAGLTQSVTSVGAKTFTRTGLIASTLYYPHFLQVDNATPPNESAVLTGTSFTTQAATPAASTGITLSGPSGGVVSAQSTDFTAGVTPVGGTIAGTVVVTPSDNGGGGTFVPISVSLTSATPTATFKYTPSGTAGARSITVTNNGGLTNPAAITYTSTAASQTAYTITGYGTPQNAVKDTIDASAIALSGSKKSVVPANQSTNIYWTIAPVPASAKSGWSDSATVPPDSDITVAQNTSGQLNGFLPMGKAAAFANDCRLWLSAADVGTKKYFWIKPPDGPAQCMNPSGTTITAF